MKSIISIVFLATFACSIHAANAENWEKITVNPRGTAYVDAVNAI